MSVVTTIELRNPDWDQLSPQQLAQADVAAAAHARADRDEKSIADLNGDPPPGIPVVGLSPRRALLARYIRWRETLQSELAMLVAKRDQLQTLVDAPNETEAKIRGGVRRTVDFLLGRSADNSDEGARAALDSELAAQRHRAEAAKSALPELEPQIEQAQMRIARLEERRKEFLNPALTELADELGLARAYQRKIAELQETAALIFGLAGVVGGFDSGVEGARTIHFPRPATPSAKHAPAEAFKIPAPGNVEIWRKAAEQLLLDPHAKATKLVSLLRI